MSTSAERRARANAWLQAQPPHLRPDATDVAIVAGLNVTSVEVLNRMVWTDWDALARSWEGLMTALRTDDPAPNNPGDLGQSAREEAVAALQGSTPEAVAEATARQAADSDHRRPELEAYLASQRAGGEGLAALDDDWVQRALDSPSKAWHDVSLRIQRKHKGPIARILAGADTTVEFRGDVGSFDVRPSLDRVHQAGHGVGFSGTPEEIRLSWPAIPGSGFTAFRVQSGLHGERPVNYDGRHVGTTGSTEVTDEEPVDGGRRFYEVWAYSGADERSARAVAPELWADGVLLDSVRGLQVHAQGGQVDATWVVPHGAGWVEVYRVPKGEYRPDAPLSHRYRIGGGRAGDNLAGFSDLDVPPGWYIYAFVVAADIDGCVRHSLRVEHEQAVVREMPDVAGFTVASGADGDTVVVGWQLPTDTRHRVEVHLTCRNVSEGALGRDLDPGALSRAGLDSATLRAKPPQDVGGRAEVALPWPDEIPRVHVVLVSRVEDVCRIAGVQTLVRSQPITEARLVERVDEQFLTFAWPQGADFVQVFAKPEGAPDDNPAAWSQITQLTAAAHADNGGVPLRDLPATGATLAIAGCSYEAGRAVLGPMLVLRYPGLTRIRYGIEAMSRTQGLLRRARTTIGLRLEVEATPAAALSVHLVHHPDRLPLHGADGTRLDRFTLVPEGGTSRVAADIPVPAERGYLRLFVDLPDEQQPDYAVLDPVVEKLMLGGAS